MANTKPAVKEVDPTRAVIDKAGTGKCRFHFTNVFEKHPEDEDYSIMVLVPISDTASIAALNAAVEALKLTDKAVAKWGGKFLSSFKTPLRSGEEYDTEKHPEYKDHLFFRANTYTQPKVVDFPGVAPILDRAEIYPGCYGRVSVSAAAFNTDGNKGIKFYLNNVQKMGDGERLMGNGASAEDDFGPANDDDFLG